MLGGMFSQQMEERKQTASDAQNYAVSWICSGEMVDLEMLEFDWLRPFWSISQ